MIQQLFAALDADLILRTPDGTQFRVFRQLLAVASPFFKDLLSLPQPPADQLTTPVIDISDEPRAMDIVLRLIYPTDEPILDTLDDISTALAVALKYEMARATRTLRRWLVSPQHLQEAPTRVYAIACRHDFEEEASIASRHTLGINILDCPLSEDLKFITAYSYHRLLDLHRKRSEAAQALMVLEDDVKCMQCSASHYGALCPPKWWSDYEKRAKEELRIHPTTDVIFSMEFLSLSAETGCQRCSQSILESHAFLARLKRRIDELPSTI
ncbi:hypothetical protein BD410DRAFT_709818 [Rickenella mellea]|uniref:BTB domain-containing protein n=1 Tax=Rickenella mellea TaxID=50990 RepID=A0A4R5XH44_9AGAM|nr:hypothetical protein BD410DRAFT_709818 [Rickenella mellea]